LPLALCSYLPFFGQFFTPLFEKVANGVSQKIRVYAVQSVVYWRGRFFESHWTRKKINLCAHQDCLHFPGVESARNRKCFILKGSGLLED
jgi:hypothetical protein